MLEARLIAVDRELNAKNYKSVIILELHAKNGKSCRLVGFVRMTRVTLRRSQVDYLYRARPFDFRNVKQSTLYDPMSARRSLKFAETRRF